MGPGVAALAGFVRVGVLGFGIMGRVMVCGVLVGIWCWGGWVLEVLEVLVVLVVVRLGCGWWFGVDVG